MIKTLTFMAMALALCMPAAAQTSGSGNYGGTTGAGTASTSGKQSGGAKADKSAKGMNMTGCVSESNGRYMLTTKDHPTGVEITSSEDLKPHVGHTVRVMTSPGGSGGAMTVTSLKMVSAKCNANGAGGTGDTTGATGTTGTTGRGGAGGTGGTGDTSGTSGTTGRGRNNTGGTGGTGSNNSGTGAPGRY